jgi:integrase
MKWAIAQGWRQDNPAENISQALPKQTQAAKHRKSLPYSEVKNCIDTIKASNSGLSIKQVLEFLILTAARSGEARLATWDEFDLGEQSDAIRANCANHAVWTIPAERMKMGREHRVPLSSRAVEILKEAKATTGSDGFVFAGTKEGKPLSDMTASKLIKSLGFDVDVHGFRTSFRTWVQEQTNAPREVAEAALAHAIKDKSEAAYARSDLFEKRRELMDDWSDYISKAQND